MDKIEDKYPECAKMKAVSKKSQAIGKFLEHMENEGYTLRIRLLQSEITLNTK